MTDQPARLPLLRPDQLDPAQRDVYDAITSGPRGQMRRRSSLASDEGGLRGPFNAMLYSPVVGDTLQRLGAALRFQTELSQREREIAILVTAARWHADFEWYAHEQIGRTAGLDEDQLTAMRQRRTPELSDPREALIHRVAVALVDDRDLSDELYAEAVGELGHPRLVDLLTLVGYYGALALQMGVFRVEVPDGDARPDWSATP